MASHAGWTYVIKTKDGFVDIEGNITKDINKARKINCLEFGFCDAAKAYQRMGFKNDDLKLSDMKYYTLEQSYDSRLGEIEGYLMDMGYDYQTACNISYNAFNSYRLSDYKKYKKYIKELIKDVSNYYKSKETDEIINLNNQYMRLHKSKRNSYEKSDYKIDKFYYEDGEIYKYSFNLKNPNIEKYFNISCDDINYYNNWQNEGIEKYLIEKLNRYISIFDIDSDLSIKLIKNNNGLLQIYFNKYEEDLIGFINESIRDFYSEKELHITRMFGSYILLQKQKGRLKAVHTTPIPIKYCPLMIKLLKEVSGDYIDELLNTLKTNDIELQEKCMCKLINETVIKSGYFDTSRPLNSCEANVLFGASETMSSAFKNHLIDAAVIVSNNLGTIITTNESNTQGAVKRMTGLFYTTASKEIVDTANNSGIIPVFPYSGKIDQLVGVKEAIRRGYKKIAVSVAANDNYLHEELKKLETEEIKIYKFGLCSTGIDEKTAIIMKENADVIWSCASKYVKEIIEPSAIAQVGIKIPVHIMTKQGWEIVKNHLIEMNYKLNDENIELKEGEGKPVFLNSKEGIKILQKKYINKCSDCPHPCV